MNKMGLLCMVLCCFSSLRLSNADEITHQASKTDLDHELKLEKSLPQSMQFKVLVLKENPVAMLKYYQDQGYSVTLDSDGKHLDFDWAGYYSSSSIRNLMIESFVGGLVFLLVLLFSTRSMLFLLFEASDLKEPEDEPVG
jgi:hypothetical protein